MKYIIIFLKLFKKNNGFRFNISQKFLYGIDYSFIFSEMNSLFPYFDKNSVPIKIDNTYNISGVCGYGLAHWNKFLIDGDLNSKEIFYKQILHLKKYPDLIYPSNLKISNLKSPWFSCLYQGLAASMFLRSYINSNNEEYKFLAKKCIINMLNIDNNLISKFNNRVFLEEFPYSNPTHVLNGFLSAYISILEYKLFTSELDFEKIASELTDSLKINIVFYNKNKWSLYEISTGRFYNYSTTHYHNLHIAQLEYVKYLTKTNSFDDLIKEWKYSNSRLRYRLAAFFGKVLYKVFN
jgi:heparosan-N-sulfate-glucuronate 5-epimerase